MPSTGTNQHLEADGSYSTQVYSGSGSKIIRGTLNAVDPGVLAAAGDYGALDVLSHSATVGVPWQFAGMARAVGRGGVITKMAVECSVEAWAAKYRLTLFHTAPTASELDDNLVGAITIAESRNIVAILETTVDSVDLGTVAYGTVTPAVPAPYACAAADTALYGILQTVDAETNEAVGMTIGIALTVIRD